MKKALLFIPAIFLIQVLNSQAYYPFPTDTAQWNSLTWAQWSPVDMLLINSQYLLRGDTTIKGKSYHKIYYNEPDFPNPHNQYIGGMREDSLKNIFFFPASVSLPTYSPTTFPNDTSETLIYTFNDLDSGMILPINQGVAIIKVIGVDSVLMGTEYRRRYKIEQRNLDYIGIVQDYWIEGIGSEMDLFMPFTYLFEWSLYTLCFTDSVTYYINSPNGKDSCHYSVPLGLYEIRPEEFSVYPNPASKEIRVEAGFDLEKSIVNIYNIQGQIMKKGIRVRSGSVINISQIKPGIYVVEIITDNKHFITKFIKE